jgi:hypothetical protein
MDYAVPLLKGSWLTSPYKEDGPPDRIPSRGKSGIDGDGEFNSMNRGSGSNFTVPPGYNQVNRDAGSNFNRVNRDAGSNFNQVNRDAGSNFNQANRDAGSNFNQANRDAGSNFNQANRDAGSNFNQVNKTAGSNFSKTAAKSDRELDSNSTNRDANSNFAKSGSGAPREPMQGMKYHMDRNTFGENRWITETDTRFAGICLKCHKKEHLTGTAQSASVHKTVKGWGNNKEHSFPCSKCHQAHNSGLPRLMQTNCFESGPPGLRDKSAATWQPPVNEPQSMQTGDPSGKNVGCHVKQFGKAGSSPESGAWREVSPW